MFDENPKYTFDFKVADDVEQTYIAQQETRDSDIVTGSYSYVDPYGSLITVNYEAGPMGYTETREVQENFVQIRAKPAKPAVVPQPQPVAVIEAKSDDTDLVARIIAQLTPFIKDTVSSAIEK